MELPRQVRKPLISLSPGNRRLNPNRSGQFIRLRRKSVRNAGRTNRLASLITDAVDATKSVTFSYDTMDRLSQSVAQTGSVKREDYLRLRGQEPASPLAAMTG